MNWEYVEIDGCEDAQEENRRSASNLSSKVLRNLSDKKHYPFSVS